MKPTAQMLGQQPLPADPIDPEESSSKNQDFFEFWFGPQGEPAQSEDPRIELEQAQARIAELEQEAGQVQLLHQRVHELEGEAEAAAELRHRVQELETELENASHELKAMRKSEGNLYLQCVTANSVAKVSQERLQESAAQAGHWQRESQELRTNLEASNLETTKLRAEIKHLEPLRVWAGHPCYKCGKPMSGSVDRKLAAQKMKDIGHVKCLR